MSWVRVPPEAVHFCLGKVTALGVLCSFALFVCLTLLASFFLPFHLSLKTCTDTSGQPGLVCIIIRLYTCNIIIRYKECGKADGQDQPGQVRDKGIL